MTLKIQHEDHVRPFEWKHFCCPLCGGKQFTSLDHTAVYCDDCNAAFGVRQTAGDPGCVVDCFTDEAHRAFIYAPAYVCHKCPEHQNVAGLFDWQPKICPRNPDHGTVERVPSQSTRWIRPNGIESFYLILKTGDYCSGWLRGGNVTTVGNYRDVPIKGPTQKQWESYCKIIDRRRERAYASRQKAASREAVTQ
jgi:hypothetical protein